MLRLFAGLVAAIFVPLAAPAILLAAPVTYKISGYIRDFGGDAYLLNGTVMRYGGFTGFYTFDDAAVDENADPAVGDYWSRGTPYGFTLNVGSYALQTDPDRAELQVEVGNGPDHFFAKSTKNRSLEN